MLLCIFFPSLILSEEMRSEITQDACMCEAQIVFQKKVLATIQELTRKHILLLLAIKDPHNGFHRKTDNLSSLFEKCLVSILC